MSGTRPTRTWKPEAGNGRRKLEEEADVEKRKQGEGRC
jgi:hypothetical protein